MNKWILIDNARESGTAWGKAPQDVYHILKSADFQDFDISSGGSRRVLGRVSIWIDLVSKILRQTSLLREGDELVLQMPVNSCLKVVSMVLLPILRWKGVSLTVLVHDLLGARGSWSREVGEEIQYKVFRAASHIIVHTSAMRDYLLRRGICASKVVVLDVFDYLCEEPLARSASTTDRYVLNIAGTLSRTAIGYISEIGKLKGLKWHLYGPNYETGTEGSDIDYHGVLPASELPRQITGGFGLVWYGESLDCLRSEIADYLELIMPHKVSLYLAAGIPIIVHKSFACADLVQRHKVGLVVSSVYEAAGIIMSMSERDYAELLNHVRILQEKVRSGWYTRQAVIKCLRK